MMEKHLQPGCLCPNPLHWALHQGCEKVLLHFVKNVEPLISLLIFEEEW